MIKPLKIAPKVPEPIVAILTELSSETVKKARKMSKMPKITALTRVRLTAQPQLPFSLPLAMLFKAARSIFLIASAIVSTSRIGVCSNVTVFLIQL